MMAANREEVENVTNELLDGRRRAGIRFQGEHGGSNLGVAVGILRRIGDQALECFEYGGAGLYLAYRRGLCMRVHILGGAYDGHRHIGGGLGDWLHTAGAGFGCAFFEDTSGVVRGMGFPSLLEFFACRKTSAVSE
jgi:hypothetical protein